MSGKRKLSNLYPARFMEKLGACAIAFAVTFMALPASAGISLPSDPLTTGTRVPANILFILDDSGSMAFEAMENPVVPTVCRRKTNGSCEPNTTITDETYVGNTVYYDPSITYQPWLNAAGELLVGGTTYESAFASFDNNSDPVDLSNPNSCAAVTRNGANRTMCGGIQTFYVPKDPSRTDANYLRDAANYYRFQIGENGDIIRSEFGPVSGGAQTILTRSGLSGSGKNWGPTFSFDVPSGSNDLRVETTGGTNSGQGFDLYVKRGAEPTQASYDCISTEKNNSKACTESSPGAGQWFVRLRGSNGGAEYSGVSLTVKLSTSNACSGTSGSSGWINCSANTPGHRSPAAEKINYATWYSYHRTRMKAAKAGASAAFSGLGTNVRVGFRTIWKRQPSGTRPVNEPKHAVPIPVGYNKGLFEDPNGRNGANNNRTQWFNRLHSAVGQSGTPLHGALRDAGEYFSSNAANGPYGPEVGADQLACRQNFSILTTDGYWNDFSNYGSGVKVGNADGTAGQKISGPKNDDYTYSPAPPFKDDLSDTLADIAMYYWKTDLSSLTNIVPTSVGNPAFWQHMVTFGISIGLRGTLDPDNDLPSLKDGTLQWPNPLLKEDARRIDDLWHAAVNGRGTFLSASNPNEFATGLKAALATITERVGSFSNVTANSTTLDADTAVFQASYVSGVWTGDLVSYPITGTGVSVTPSWRASEKIPTSGRKILTFDGTNGVGFPTMAQAQSLARTGASNYPVSGSDNAGYIAGVRTLEIEKGGTLRTRNHVLGDIVSSSPAYSKDTNTVFVGANDGMLHAFSAATGAELFAYIPASINWSDLSTLSRPDYAHRYFVDGPVVVSDRTQTPGKNLLVGSLGKGGKGLFALDVTNPQSFTANKVLWEDSETPLGNMGLVQGKPIIAELNNGVTGLIVSNGVNSSHDRAVLLVYDLETGDLLKEIDTLAGSTSSPNGLSPPVGWDSDGNGTLDSVYAGDHLGNVWKFDLAESSTSGWKVANAGSALFKASHGTGASTKAQPITGGLTVAMHPTTYQTWLFFGTGRLMTVGDVENRDVQSMYGLVDTGATVLKTALTKRNIKQVGTRDLRPVRGFDAQTPLPLDSKGWYVDLVMPPNTAEGERIVTDAQVVGNVLVTSSVIPTANACESDGRGYINALDAFTGTSTGPSFFDLNNDGSFDDETIGTGDNQVPIGSVDLGVGMPTLGSLLRGRMVVGGSTGGTASVPTRETRNVGRVSWREVVGE
ncbi:PilC/PilY family type IV pilus protein [Lysobacter sp. A03]|uniref:PilC/PilY family type IV pilus protein n=1 Tax=Lysobacter sp. A03 TaxID=1199154 RepID=UPI0005B71598|nr:PilC/PilY family type IV pilus protein [Lysobacter sp. A03]KIQ97140.1 Type IV fimbrial biogenesis protein PilY1 [Lysobacter sp. A03]